jgi:voltage-gated potassium channel Kch
MSLAEAIEATPHAALEDAATEMASAIAVVAATFHEMGLVTDPETIFPFVDLLLSRADATSFDEEETEEDADVLVVGA